MTAAGAAHIAAEWARLVVRAHAGDGPPAAVVASLAAQLAAGALSATVPIPKRHSATGRPEVLRVDRAPPWWADN